MTKQLIAHAIRSRRRLAVAYRHIRRVVEPHAYGLNGYGKAVLLCYEVGSEGQSLSSPGWHLLNLESSTTVIAIDEEFKGPRRGYRRDDTGICAVLEQL